MTTNPNPAIRTGSPFIRVRIGEEDVFTSGDGLLQECEFSLNEGSGLSSCQFAIYDKGRVYANKYFEVIFQNDGLEPLFDPRSSQSSGSGGASGAAQSVEFDGNKVNYMIDVYHAEGFSPYAIAALIGNAQQESSLDPGAEANDQEDSSNGLFQWTFERKEGMPWDFEGQVLFSIEEMQRDGGAIAADTYGVLKDPNASVAEVQEAIEAWIRWGEVGARWEYTEDLLPTVEARIAGSNQAAANSADRAREPEEREEGSERQTVAVARIGQQITIEAGFSGETIAAYSFLHTSLSFDLFSPDKLVFGGQAAAWVLAQRRKNTAYTNMTLKQIAMAICRQYGLTLEMGEDGPTYEYFPQRGVSDYEALLIECRRLGYRIQSIGRVLKIGAREANPTGFVLAYGENMGLSFSVSHSAQSDTGGGARASDPNDRATTGERKWVVDPDSGELVQTTLEDGTGTGTQDNTATATTGNHVSQIAPLIRQSNNENDAARREAERRIKGIVANWSAPTLPEMLLLDPDSSLNTEGISPFLDRIWVIESITHKYSVGDGFTTSGTIYTPLKNKYPAPVSSSGSGAPVSFPEGCRGKLLQAAIEYEGTDTSAGPDAGTQACVWAVNRIFENAGLTIPWGGSNFVPDAEAALQTSATLVEAGDEQPGDIVIGDDGVRGHIGIVVGDNLVLSNSSSAAAFRWKSDMQMGGNYGPVRVYRLNC